MSLSDKTRGIIIAMFGFILSPLSWWNNLYINLPIAYALAWLVSLIDGRLFSIALVGVYWCSNIVGLVLLHKNSASVAFSKKVKSRSRKERIFSNLELSVVYTVIVIVLLHLGLIKLPQDYFGH